LNLCIFFYLVWADNADVVSLQYAGTGALKTDYTRTGQRSTKGLLRDGYNSCARYVLNNFFDGFRQVEKYFSLETYLVFFSIKRMVLISFWVIIKSHQMKDVHPNHVQ
jgi:hypothetical protein